MEENIQNLLVAFISTNGVAIMTFIVNIIVTAVRSKAAAKKTPSYANVELQLMRINARLDKIEKKGE